MQIIGGKLNMQAACTHRFRPAANSAVLIIYAFAQVVNAQCRISCTTSRSGTVHCKSIRKKAKNDSGFQAWWGMRYGIEPLKRVNGGNDFPFCAQS